MTSVKKEEEETRQEVGKRSKSPPPPVPEKPKSPTRTKAQQEQQKQQESETTKTETEEATAEAEEPSRDKEVEEEERRADDSSTTLKMSAEQQQLEQTATEEDSNKENNNNDDEDDDDGEASLEEHKATIDDVTARDITADDFDALKRNGHSALERRASGSRKNQGKNGAAPIKSFLHGGDGVRRRNSTAAATAPPSVELHLCADQHKQEERLSGEEEMLERRRERLKQASPDRPRLLQIDRVAARSRAHTLENMADASPMVRSLRSSTMTSPPVRGGDEAEEMISSPVSSSSSAMSTASSSVRPDSISSCMSTTSGEFNLASEYDKIARQLADDDDDERAEDGDVIDDETLKRGGGKKRNVETQGDRKSVEVPSKQRAEDWHGDEADKGEAPPDAPVEPQVVEASAQPVPEPPPPPLQQQQPVS